MKDANTAAFGDADVALALLSGEVCHEVTHTMNFLRLLVLDPASGPDEELVRFAKAELERLQRLVGQLRGLKLPVPERENAPLAELVTQSIEKVQELVTKRRLSIDVCIPVDACIREDVRGLRSALRNLLLDVLARAPAGSCITIATIDSAQSPLLLEFSDDGEALPDVDGAELQWQNAVRSSSPGFRRLLAHRLLRHLGWAVCYERRAQRNVTRLTAPLPRSPSP